MEEKVSPTGESHWALFKRFLRFGCLAWGGPVAQIAMIRQELVEEEKWVSPERFNRVLAVYQVLPGPEAHELCVYFGMVKKGRVGGFLAGLGFMLPGLLLMLLLTWAYIAAGMKDPALKAIFAGLHCVVISLIVAAVHRLGKHALVNAPLLVLGVFSAIFHFLQVPFYWVLPAAGVLYVLYRQDYRSVSIISLVILSVAAVVFGDFHSPSVSPGLAAGPVLSGGSDVQVFFSGLKAGLLTFGGAYTAIPFVQHDAVTVHRWLSNAQFLEGIALSGILPAPLIIFTTFVGFFGAGWSGAMLMTAGVFLPAFAFTLAGHQLVELIVNNRRLHDFLDGVTAAVIGLIAVTAIKLFSITIVNLQTLLVFTAGLLMLYLLKIKSATPLVIASGAVLGWLLLR